MAALSGGIADAGSDRFAGYGSADVARFKQVENHDRNVVVFAQGDGGAVHHSQFATQHVLIAEVGVLHGIGMLGRIFVVDPIHLGGFEHHISVEYYGAETPLKSLATLSTPDSQTIQIQPFDISALASIEKAIAMSELGFTPNNDGKIIRINVPPLTEERRKEFCKLASKYAEEGKVALRNLRRDAIDKIKKQEKEGEFSEDQSRDEQDGVQKTLDKFIAELEKHLATKEADILKV